MKLMKILALIFIAVCSFTQPSVGSDFATSMVSYNPGPGNIGFSNPDMALGVPVGGTLSSPDSSSVVSLGDGGSITLALDHDILDDPANPYGLDFIVFSNAFFKGGDPRFHWQELAFVEVRQENSEWYLIPPSKPISQLIGGVDTGDSYTIVNGYAEYSPTLALAGNRTATEYYTIPDRPSIPEGMGINLDVDAVSGGGDAFDISKAVKESQSTPGVPILDGAGQMISAEITSIKYIRITDALVRDSMSDPRIGLIRADIDAVSDVIPAKSIGETKKSIQSSFTVITEAIVTASSSDHFFVESPNRSAAMKVIAANAPAVGNTVTLTGHLAKTNRRFELTNPLFTVTSTTTNAPGPLGMPIKSLRLDAVYGMLIRTWGKVTDLGDGHYCTITDGNNSVKLTYNQQYNLTGTEYLCVTGICDREGVNGDTVLRVSDPSTNISTY